MIFNVDEKIDTSIQSELFHNLTGNTYLTTQALSEHKQLGLMFIRVVLKHSWINSVRYRMLISLENRMIRKQHNRLLLEGITFFFINLIVTRITSVLN